MEVIILKAIPTIETDMLFKIRLTYVHPTSQTLGYGSPRNRHISTTACTQKTSAITRKGRSSIDARMWQSSRR